MTAVKGESVGNIPGAEEKLTTIYERGAYYGNIY